MSRIENTQATTFLEFGTWQAVPGWPWHADNRKSRTHKLIPGPNYQIFYRILEVIRSRNSIAFTLNRSQCIKLLQAQSHINISIQNFNDIIEEVGGGSICASGLFCYPRARE